MWRHWQGAIHWSGTLVRCLRSTPLPCNASFQAWVLLFIGGFINNKLTTYGGLDYTGIVIWCCGHHKMALQDQFQWIGICFWMKNCSLDPGKLRRDFRFLNIQQNQASISCECRLNTWTIASIDNLNWLGWVSGTPLLVRASISKADCGSNSFPPMPWQKFSDWRNRNQSINTQFHLFIHMISCFFYGELVIRILSGFSE